MSSLFSYLGRRREATPPISAPTDGPHTGKGEQGGSFGVHVAYAGTPESALTVSAVYRAIELRSKTIGIMPVQLRKRDFEKGNLTPYMRGIGKRINYLLQVEPNPVMTAASLWEQVTINRLQLGNGFVYIQRDEYGDPVALWLAVSGGYNYMEGTYNLTYLSENGIQYRYNVPAADVLHFPNTYRMQNGFWGMPTLQFAAETLSLIKTQKQQSLESAAKGGRVKLLIGEEKGSTVAPIAMGMFDKDQMDSYAAEVNDKIYKQDVVALRGLDKVQNISMTSAEMQIIEQLGMSYDDVARFYGIPRPLLMLDTNSHYNDYQNATMEFHARTVLPDKNDMEREFFRKLLGPKYYGTFDIHICEKPLLAMDPERQAKVDQLNLQTGAKTVNEIRAEHDMPSVENGDIVYISTNVAELGSKKLSGEDSTELQPGNYTVKGGNAEPKEGEDK